MLKLIKRIFLPSAKLANQIEFPGEVLDDGLNPQFSSNNSTLLKKGNAAIRAEDFEKAIHFYKKSIEIDSTCQAAYIGIGFALMQMYKFSAAVIELQNAIKLDPESLDGFYMLGKANYELRNFDAAEDAWNKAFNISPLIESIYCDFCLLLFNKGNIEHARALIAVGVENYPFNPDLHFYQGNLYASTGDYQAAVSSYEKSFELNPHSPYMLSNYGTALRQMGKLDFSLDLIKKAIFLAPNASSIFSNYLFGIQYSAAFTKEEKFQAHLEYSGKFESPLLAEWGNYKNDFLSDRKIKIGYVSGDFRNHSLVFFIEPILKNHDRSKFEIYCYYSYPLHDAASERIKCLANHWMPCSQMSDEELASKIRSDCIDILIDLSGHTGHNRLLTFARRPAPVQMTWLGYQSTTGLSAIDFRITDESLDPIGTSETFHSEKLLRLSSCGSFSPSPDSPSVNALPALNGSQFTFGCLNNPSKITETVIFAWAKILKKNLTTRLMIGGATPGLVQKILAQFLQHEITSDRVLFNPKVSLRDYLELYGEIDLALDTFPYNGGTTTFHSLWMGVPIIALQGDTSLSNVGVSVMKGLELGHFCADTVEDYVERAVYFSNHIEELDLVRQSLREKMNFFTNHLSKEVTTSLERSLQICWQEFCEKMQQT